MKDEENLPLDLSMNGPQETVSPCIPLNHQHSSDVGEKCKSHIQVLNSIPRQSTISTCPPVILIQPVKFLNPSYQYSQKPPKLLHSSFKHQTTSTASSNDDKIHVGKISRRKKPSCKNNHQNGASATSISLKENDLVMVDQTLASTSSSEEPVFPCGQEVGERTLKSNQTVQTIQKAPKAKKRMVKINEKMTSNGGLFCTFRNFTTKSEREKQK